MAISTADFKNGMTLDLDEGLFRIQSFQHVKPGKGGAFVRTTLKDVRTGAVRERTFRAGERMEQARIEHGDKQYLYRDGNDVVFMDTETYEQLRVPATAIGDVLDYVKESDIVRLAMYGDEVVGVDLPAAVVLRIAVTEPGVQGDRVSGARKPATLETGKVVQVPLFIEAGEVVKVDTRSGEYIERVSS
jgi:elongation factor P